MALLVVGAGGAPVRDTCGGPGDARCREKQLAGTCNAPGDGSCTEKKLSGSSSNNGTVEWDRFERDGYIVFPGVLTPDQVKRAKRAFRTSRDSTHHMGQFRQEGSLIELDPVFAEFLESLPQEVEDKMASILGPWIVGGYAQITLNPLPGWAHPKDDESQRKARSKGLHSDFPYGHSGLGWGCNAIPGVRECLTVVPPQYPRTLQLIFMLDDFTEQNGGTLLLPGSHRDRRLPNSVQDSRGTFGRLAKNAVGRAGDLIMYVGFMWHSSGVNVAPQERAAVIVQCLPYYFKPMHSHSYRLPNRVARTLSPKMRNRLGLTGYTWFKHTGQLGNGKPQPLRHAWLMLWDALWYGYPARKPGQEVACRKYVFLSLAMPLLCLLPCRVVDCLKLLLAITVGLLLGVGLALEKFQM